MSRITTDTSALSAYASKHEKQLIAKLYKELNPTADGIDIMTGVKVETKLPRLKIGKGIKPATGNFVVRAGDFKYSDTTISVKKAQRDTEIAPEDYRETYLSDFVAASMGTNSNLASQIPFEQFTWEQFMQENAQEVVEMFYEGLGTAAFAAYNNTTHYSVGALVYYTVLTEVRYFKCIASTGGGANPTDATKWVNVDNLAVTKGWGAIIQDAIDDDGFDQIVSTGAINSDDAYDQFTALWRGQNPLVRKKGGLIYCGQDQYDMLVDSYEAFAEKNFTRTEGLTTLPKTNGKCELKVVDWLSESGALICTPAKNLVMATDSMSDLNKLKTIEQMYKLDVGLSFLIGLGIRDFDYLTINDQ